MKKYIVILLSLLSLTAYAQNVKKVAVWETKCSDNSVLPMYATMVRGGMETAVGNTSGYEVFDRSAFDVLMKEHGFQRSGAVNDADIKKLGEMAGVQYVIVPEAMANGNEFYIIVKMLDVESGKFGGVYDALCAGNASDIYKTCRELRTKLFGSKNGQAELKPVKKERKYVDLGLPSGILWSDQNEEGYFTQNEAIQKYGNAVPTIWELDELKKKCVWRAEGTQFKVIGPNGNYIYLPANGKKTSTKTSHPVGDYGTIWSSTSIEKGNVSGLGFWIKDNYICLWDYKPDESLSVRLVKRR